MRSLYISLSFFAVLCTFLRFLAFEYLSPPSMPELSLCRLYGCTDLDAEATFALGARMPFSRCGVFELELIPRISDTLAFRIMAKKDEIIEKAKELPIGKRHEALEVVKGIGEKTAKSLCLYLDLGA